MLQVTERIQLFHTGTGKKWEFNNGLHPDQEDSDPARQCFFETHFDLLNDRDYVYTRAGQKKNKTRDSKAHCT